jgi:RNA polymerase sigma factor (sigma-70 family)
VPLTTGRPDPPHDEPPLLYTLESFDVFYRREYPAIVGLVYALCGRRAVAEELAQDAFLVAHRRWDLVGRYESPGGFVRHVAADFAVSHRRRVSAEARALVRLAAGARPVAAPLEPDSAAFWRMVRVLPRRQAQTVALFYLEDRSTTEIASILECAESTVKVHLHRARNRLARDLGAGGADG